MPTTLSKASRLIFSLGIILLKCFALSDSAALLKTELSKTLSAWKPRWHLPHLLGERRMSRNLDFKPTRASQDCGCNHLQPLPGQGRSPGEAGGREGTDEFQGCSCQVRPEPRIHVPAVRAVPTALPSARHVSPAPYTHNGTHTLIPHLLSPSCPWGSGQHSPPLSPPWLPLVAGLLRYRPEHPVLTASCLPRL